MPADRATVATAPGPVAPGSDRSPYLWVGQSVARREDARLLRGRGRFTDDLDSSRALHAAFVRSPVAAGELRAVDAAEAERAEGVLGVFTAADLGRPSLRAVLERDGFVATDMPLLAHDRVRYCGEPIAIVVAEDAYLAEDAAELVVADIAESPAVVDLADASSGGVHDEAPDGVLVDLQMFDDPEVAGLLENSHLVLTETFSSGRVHASPMECRAVLAELDGRSGQLVLTISTQVPHQVRTGVSQALGIPEADIRVIAPDVGGGFGVKCVVGREEVVCAAVARRLGRTVRWSEDRQQSLMASFAGHEQCYEVQAGFDGDGRLTALVADIRADVGAYSVFPFTCGVEPLMACTELPGVYKVPAYAARGRGLATNKSPTAPYRGVSRPQIVLVMEALLDQAADTLGLDRVEIRRRNLIQPNDFPYLGPNLITYEPGSYLESLDACEKLVAASGWARSVERTDPGVRYGIGFSCFSERAGYGTATMGARRMGMTPGYDVAHVRMDPSGHVTVSTGTCGHGQGHETTFAQIVADRLGVHPDIVHLRQGDTDLASYGWGTFASRSLMIGGSAAGRAAVRLADKVKAAAAEILEADPGDVRLEEGAAWVDNVSLPIQEVAARVHFRAHEFVELPDRVLEAQGQADPVGCFSNATHAALVRIDEGTGEAHVVDYLVVEDCGRIINPVVVDGQVRGGVAQGIAAALYERLVYSPEGQPLSATFMDYLVPTACEIPPITIHHLCTPTDQNELGAKGMGEGGTIGAPAAVLSAINAALADTGTRFTHLPVLPAQIAAALTGSAPATTGGQR